MGSCSLAGKWPEKKDMNEIHIKKGSKAVTHISSAEKQSWDKENKMESPQNRKGYRAADMENPQGTGVDKSVSRE